MTDYETFLQQKAQGGHEKGFEPLWFPSQLFDFQEALTSWAIRKGRGAIWADCGLGKSPMSLTWAENVVRYTGKRVLILTPLAVGVQMVAEGEKFGIACERSRDGGFGKAKIIITNYEQLHHFQPNDFVGVVGDESSILKHFAGATQKTATRFMSKIPYRLLDSATAAPNDHTELGTASEALGELTYTDMLKRFFHYDDGKERRRAMSALAEDRPGQYYARLAYRVSQQIGSWRLKAHAETPFWQWVASWARACRKPSDLGFSDERFTLPPLTVNEHIMQPHKPAAGMLFSLPAFGLKEEREERRRTLQERCEFVKELVNHDRPALVWCHLNEEGDFLERIIPEAKQIAGRHSDEEKETRWLDFIARRLRVIICKPKIGAWGLNLQHCAHVVTFASHCYDEETEILTKRGWITFDQVTCQDEVATANPDSLAFEWQHPTDIIWSPYEGPMIHFCGDGIYHRSFDLLVTPNHRMFVKRCPTRYHTSIGSYEFKEAQWFMNHFRKQEYRMLRSPSLFYGTKLDSIDIPPYENEHPYVVPEFNRSGNKRGLSPASRQHFKPNNIMVNQLTIDQFLRLAGWYLSEGYCGSRRGVLDGQITICQGFGNPKHREEIITLLQSIPGMTVYTKTKDIRCCSKQLAHFLVKLFGAGSHLKHIPAWVKELASDHLEVLRDTMLKGDGCSAKKGGEKRSYRTVSRQLADDFLEICLKTGIRASIKFRRMATMDHHGKPGIYEVNIARKTIEPYIHVQPKVESYCGMIGCVTVPNGTLIVRRNGIPLVSGNSYEQYYQSIRRCWRFGQQQPVRVDIVATEGERRVIANMLRKEQVADTQFTQLISHMHDALHIALVSHHDNPLEVPEWLS